jgi:hypothetical protein
MVRLPAASSAVARVMPATPPNSRVGREGGLEVQKLEAQEAAKRMFELGDTEFNNPAHHGEPEFRSTMIRAGYDEAGISVQEAFEKSRRVTGLA